MELTPADHADLERLERRIDLGIETFMDVGRCLLEIRNRRLYKIGGYASFAQYCHERWNLQRGRAYQLIDAARVVQAITDGTDGAATIAEHFTDESPEMSTIVDTPSGPAPSTVVELPTNEAQTRELARLKEPRAIRQVWQQVRMEHGDDTTAKDVRAAVDRHLDQTAPYDQAKAEQAQSDRYLSLVGDPDGNIARASLRASFTSAVAYTRNKLLPLRPDAVVAVLTAEDLGTAEWFVVDCRQWLNDLDAALKHGVYIVEEVE